MSRSHVAVFVVGFIMAQPSAQASVGRDENVVRGAEAEACGSATTTRTDPVSELRASDLELAAILRRRVPSWSPEADAVHVRLEHLLAGILDYEGIARGALGVHWETLSVQQRHAFLALFSPLTNGALLTAAGRHVAVQYDSEEVSGAERQWS